ncbi:MAG: response regulator [Pseudomonadota bacterium]|nr:response regulator [Pseudomonadota bacterium]
MASRILMIEDQRYLAMMVEDILVDAGYEVMIAGRVDSAMALLNTGSFDAAVLDINLGGETVFPLAQALIDRDVPCLLTSAYDTCSIHVAFRGLPILDKPYRPDRLLRSVGELLGAAGVLPEGGDATRN